MRTKLADRKLPNYSIGEERFNYISHIVGGVIGIVALILFVAIISIYIFRKRKVFKFCRYN